MTPELVKETRRLLPGVDLRKAWGFTELGGMATQGQATPDRRVGRPVANTRVYVLDNDLQPVPIGAIGELCVAAAHLARGYLDRPELTAARFLTDPFQLPDKVPLYRTGDLGRLNWDGTIDFLGRRDHQVKVRGYRVHLGEVEAALLSHAGIAEAAVVLQATEEHERLLAYVARKPSSQVPEAELRAHLSQRLPQYMVPAFISFLTSLPLTDSGKIDRQALPAPVTEPSMTPEYSAARDDIERFLVHVWSASLGLPSLGIHDHFLELGGDSIFAVHVVAQVWDELKIELPVMALFEYPTIAQLAAVISERLRATTA